jgi:hypothetical protein
MTKILWLAVLLGFILPGGWPSERACLIANPGAQCVEAGE